MMLSYPRSILSRVFGARNLEVVNTTEVLKKFMGSLNKMDVLLNHDDAQVKSMQEMCIVVSENDEVLGQRSKKDCHLMENINNGLLHRAFSVLLFNEKEEFLLTQRAKTKITFPGYYTNACCSHPLYNNMELDETNDAIGVRRAARRRLELELGIPMSDMSLDEIKYMTRIVYRAASDDPIWGEAEIDYILIIKKDLNLKPLENEVCSHLYLSKEKLVPFLDSVEKNGGKVSPWFRLIVDKFLFQYWDNLDDLDKLKDLKNIHGL